MDRFEHADNFDHQTSRVDSRRQTTSELEGWFFVELDRLLRERVSDARRAEVLSEFRDHVDASVEAHMELGATREEAGKLTIESLGSSSQIVSKLVTAIPPQVTNGRIVSWTMAIASTCFGILWLVHAEL